MVKVAIQGNEASFHDIAAKQYFGSDIEVIGTDTFALAFQEVQNKHADFAVCAIENSLFGSINETYDLLVKYHFTIVGEVYLRIEQCLVALPGVALEDIEEVYSHPVALAQCEAYLDETLPTAKRLEFHDTAASVAYVQENGLKNAAAIAGRAAAELHGMQILAAEIETNKQNYTRFIVLAPSRQQLDQSNKTSLIIRTSHKPGALYDALGVFARRSINLSKLQSRPIIGKAWHYMFYVDVEAGSDHAQFAQALLDLAQQDCEVTLLGSYLAGQKV